MPLTHGTLSIFGENLTGTNLLSNAGLIGKVFYVDRLHTKASDSNAGTDPDLPLNTIQVAWDKCTNLKNDYVFCINTRAEDTSAITGTKTTAHIIGMPQITHFSNNNIPRPAGDTAMFVFPTAAIRTEIAGFNMNGGANHGAIETSGDPSILWIHHNVFGSEYAGTATPKYGIYCNHLPTGPTNCLIEDNFFYGTTGMIALGKIDSNAIYMAACKGLVLRRNVIMGIPGVAINIVGMQGGAILNNQISVDSNRAGGAITLSAGCEGCWIDGNSAHFGDSGAMNNSPYADDGADANNWGSNTCFGAQEAPDA